MGDIGFLRVGQRVRARVTAIYDAGAWVEFSRYRGLIASSEISEQDATKVADHMAVGDTVYAWICDLDPGRGQVDLTLIEHHARTSIDDETVGRIQAIVRLNMADPSIDAAERAVAWLARTKDHDTKQAILDLIDECLAEALESDEATLEVVQLISAHGDDSSLKDVVGHEPEAWPRVELALRLDATLRTSIDPSWDASDLRYIAGSVQRVPSRAERLRRRIEFEQQQASALRSIGVTPGGGLPFWSMYMTRRNKKSWGS